MIDIEIPNFLTAQRLRRFYNPEKLHGRYPIVNVMLIGSLASLLILLGLLAVSFFLTKDTFTETRLIGCAIGFIYLLVVARFAVAHRQDVAARLLVIFYSGVAIIILTLWGLNAQIGILILSFVIILSSTIIGARSTLPVTIGVIFILIALHATQVWRDARPNEPPISMSSTISSVASYATIFAVFGLVSWLGGRKTEQALQKAKQAELDLEKQKDLLAIRLDEKTRQLHDVQLEEMRQLYHFAELGQLSTAVLHDLANHLSVLTMDIEDIQKRHEQSESLTHAKESIRYLDDMINKVRRRLKSTDESKYFQVFPVIQDVINTLQLEAYKHHVEIELQPQKTKKAPRTFGDPLRLSQTITILLTNALEATKNTQTSTLQKIIVNIEIIKSMTYIRVTDYGSGISPSRRKTLFEPSRSSKSNGMGIGLFIAKETVETHFKGAIELDPRIDQTTFLIKLPGRRPDIVRYAA